MDTTTFLAALWGPSILAVGLGVFLSRSYYIGIYRDLEKSALASLVFGMMAMAAGLAQVHFHNAWGTLPEFVVSLLGWGLLVKGALFLVFPRFVDKAGDAWVNLKLVPFAGVLMLVLGVYLTWLGYFI